MLVVGQSFLWDFSPHPRSGTGGSSVLLRRVTSATSPVQLAMRPVTEPSSASKGRRRWGPVSQASGSSWCRSKSCPSAFSAPSTSGEAGCVLPAWSAVCHGWSPFGLESVLFGEAGLDAAGDLPQPLAITTRIISRRVTRAEFEQEVLDLLI